jgi:predicted lipid-binding transport protein (Tim44 family)
LDYINLKQIANQMTDLELIIFGGAAIFFAYKLWSVLGKTNGQEQARPAQMATSTEKQNAVTNALPKIIDIKPEKVEPEEIIPAHLQEGVKKIKTLDKSFTLKLFEQTAEDIFEQVIRSFSDKKAEELKKLLSADVFKGFEDELKTLEAAGRQRSSTLLSNHAPELLSAEVTFSTAHIVVKFSSEQVHLLKNQAGEIIEGAVNQSDEVTEIWTFERNFADKKAANWVVAGIQAE